MQSGFSSSWSLYDEAKFRVSAIEAGLADRLEPMPAADRVALALLGRSRYDGPERRSPWSRASREVVASAAVR